MAIVDIKFPSDMNDCCKESWKTYSVGTANSGGEATIPVLYRFCVECGKKIRPTKNCCVSAVFYGNKFCPVCGESVHKFFVLEVKNG